MKSTAFKQLMRLVHAERPFIEIQRDILQKVIDSDQTEDMVYFLCNGCNRKISPKTMASSLKYCCQMSWEGIPEEMKLDFTQFEMREK